MVEFIESLSYKFKTNLVDIYVSELCRLCSLTTDAQII